MKSYCGGEPDRIMIYLVDYVMNGPGNRFGEVT